MRKSLEEPGVVSGGSEEVEVVDGPGTSGEVELDSTEKVEMLEVVIGVARTSGELGTSDEVELDLSDEVAVLELDSSVLVAVMLEDESSVLEAIMVLKDICSELEVVAGVGNTLEELGISDDELV